MFYTNQSAWETANPNTIQDNLQTVATPYGTTSVGTAYRSSTGAVISSSDSYTVYNYGTGSNSSSSYGPYATSGEVIDPSISASPNFGTGKYLYWGYNNSLNDATGSTTDTYQYLSCGWGCYWNNLNTWNGQSNPITTYSNNGTNYSQPIVISLPGSGVSSIAFDLGQYSSYENRNRQIWATVRTQSATYTEVVSNTYGSMNFLGFEDSTDPITSITLTPVLSAVTSNQSGSGTSQTFSCVVNGYSGNTCRYLYSYNDTYSNDSTSLALGNLQIDAPVPEPAFAPALLLLTGGLVLFRRRRTAR